MSVIKVDYGSIEGGEKVNFGVIRTNATVTLGYQPTFLQITAAHTTSAYNPVAEKYENGTWYYASGSNYWNDGWESSGNSPIYNDITITSDGFSINLAGDRILAFYEARP